MFEKAAYVSTGDISQINAKNYHHHGTTSNVVSITSGGQYSNHVEINAKAYHHHEVRTADPLRELYSNVAVGAMHISEDRVDAPKCHPETRKAVQQDIFSWISYGVLGDREEEILWLTGPAGAGKTAIMGTICDKLQETGQLAATFYFSSHNGGAERRSKRHFVTTLAYQLQRHPCMKEELSEPMKAAIAEDPALFHTSLQGQMDALILQPLRLRQGPTANRTLVIVVDGVDECGEHGYHDADRSREKDQIEVLSVLLHAARDPSFPFQVIVASRPEDWIRRFFAEAPASHPLGHITDQHSESRALRHHPSKSVPVRVTEIFLDNKYSPGKDIKLFLEHKFAELCRRYRFPPGSWPRQEDVETLVKNASGQFIYAATVMRFVDSPSAPPKSQLSIILSIKPTADSLTAFRRLDDLYTAILNFSPSPRETVLWLKAHERLRKNAYTIAGARDAIRIICSAWTIERLFESSEGQARIILNIPSLLWLDYTPKFIAWACDTAAYGQSLPASLQPAGWEWGYKFYHKSFLDFLHDPRRCATAFPGTDTTDVEHWLWERFSIVILCTYLFPQPFLLY